MKAITVPILITLAVIMATVLYGNRIYREEDEVDKVKMALTGINKFISPGSRLTYTYVDIEPNLIVAMHAWCRYELTPAYVAFQNNKYDTMLTVCRRNKADSFLAAIAGKKVLWRNEDAQHYYFLTSSH